MAELDGDFLRTKEQTTPSKNSDVMHLLSNSGTRSLARIVYSPESAKTQTQGEFLFDVDVITGERKITTSDKNDFSLTTTTALTPKDHALFDCFNDGFTKSINYKNIKPADLTVDNLTINLSLIDYMRICGKDDEYLSNSDNIKKFRKRDIAPSLDHLLDFKVSWQTSEGYFDGIHPFTRLRVDGKTITAEFGGTFARALINRRESELMLYDPRLIQIPYDNQGKSRAKDVAFILGKKLYEHSSMPNNIKASENGYMSLSVKKAVDAVRLCLKPDIKSPVKEIINPIYEALEILADKNIIDYCFCGKNKHRLNNAETDKVLSDYATFISAYICFKVIRFKTEETKQQLITDRTNRAERRRRGRPPINHNKVYENPKG